MLDVLVLPGGQVVERDHGVALLEQQVSKVRPDEAGSTRNESTHAAEGTSLGTTLAHVSRRLGFRRPPLVLCYHAFDVRPPDLDPYHLFVSMDRFRRQLDLLQRRGWQPLDGDRYLAGIRTGRWPRKAFLITIDDGYASTRGAADELARRGIPSLLFLPPARLGGRSVWMDSMPDEPLLTVAEVQALPGEVEVGVHGGDHRDLPGLAADELRRQVDDAAEQTRIITGVRPRFFAYPRGLHDGPVRRAVADAGYAAAFATHRGSGTYAIRRVDVLSIDTEFTFALKVRRWYAAARRLGPRLGPAWHLARRVLRL
jgi:peptidoglycan/xylan/chitin deacetylase (PgdA/CDA1 family)